MKFLTHIVDLAIVNVLTVVHALGIVTAGGALTAMNYVLFHLQRRDETYVAKMFRKSFKDNFRQGMPLGLIAIAVAIVTAADLWGMHALNSKIITMMMIAITVIAGFLFVTFVYMFALQSRYENTVKGTIANAFKLAIGNLPRTALMMIIWILWTGVLSIFTVRHCWRLYSMVFHFRGSCAQCSTNRCSLNWKRIVPTQHK